MTKPYMTDFEWSQECDYVSSVSDALLHTARQALHPKLAPFNQDEDCFVRYCEMQRDAAERDGKHDVTQYIQHCLDDIGMD